MVASWAIAGGTEPSATTAAVVKSTSALRTELIFAPLHISHRGVVATAVTNVVLAAVVAR
jgi:hypothetical protein